MIIATALILLLNHFIYHVLFNAAQYNFAYVLYDYSNPHMRIIWVIRDFNAKSGIVRNWISVTLLVYIYTLINISNILYRQHSRINFPRGIIALSHSIIGSHKILEVYTEKEYLNIVLWNVKFISANEFYVPPISFQVFFSQYVMNMKNWGGRWRESTILFPLDPCSCFMNRDWYSDQWSFKMKLRL